MGFIKIKNCRAFLLADISVILNVFFYFQGICFTLWFFWIDISSIPEKGIEEMSIQENDAKAKI